MYVAGLVEHSQKSFAEVMAEQLEEQQNMFVGGHGVLEQQAAMSFMAASAGHAGMNEKAATAVPDLFAKDDFIMSNGIKAMMRRQRAYGQMQDGKLAVKAVANGDTVPVDFSSDVCATTPPANLGGIVATPRVAVSAPTQVSMRQPAVRTVI